MQKLLLTIDKVSARGSATRSRGSSFATLLISWEVFSATCRASACWAFDAMIMMYGTLFMMAGDIRCPRTGTCAAMCCTASSTAPAGVARLSSTLFLIPGVVAWLGGLHLRGESWAINEHSNITSDGPPSIRSRPSSARRRGDLLQGIVEIMRCVVCIRQGLWPLARGGRGEVDVDK